MKQGITKERQAEIDAHDKAKEYAEATFQRGYGGQVSHRWEGAQSRPVLVSAEIEAEMGEYLAGALGLVRIRDVDDRTALYAKP